MYNELKKRAFDANMELYHRGLVIYTWGNVSQADRMTSAFAIKPSGVEYEKLTWQDMVVLSIENGKVLEGDLNPSSDTPTHLGLYRAFSDVGGITHTHSTFATAFAQAGISIECLGTTHADQFRGRIPVTRLLTQAEIDSGYEANTALVIAEAFRDSDPMYTPGCLVKGHGPFTWGRDAMASVYSAAVLEEVAKMAYLTKTLNPQCEELAQRVQDKHFYRKHGKNAYYGQKKK